MHGIWANFWELLRVPFQHEEMVWGIVPLYFGWAVNELTSAKVSFGTAIQTGFALLWSASHWGWQLFRHPPAKAVRLAAHGVPPVNVAVTVLVLLIGAVALWSGLRRRYPRGLRFLGHSRFSAFFMIAIFPIQSGYLAWRWDYVVAIAACAVPVWLVLHFALMPLRR